MGNRNYFTPAQLTSFIRGSAQLLPQWPAMNANFNSGNAFRGARFGDANELDLSSADPSNPVVFDNGTEMDLSSANPNAPITYDYNGALNTPPVPKPSVPNSQVAGSSSGVASAGVASTGTSMLLPLLAIGIGLAFYFLRHPEASQKRED